MTAGRAALLVALLAGLLPGCGAQESSRELAVGAYQVRVRIPAGWEVVDQGRQILIRRASAELVLQDLGPAGPPGIRREVERAQDLWRAGRGNEARWRMANVPIPRELFSTPADRRWFSAAWSRVSNARADIPYEDVQPAFAVILANIDVMPPRPLPALVDAGLAELGHDQRRDVKVGRPMTVDGHEALDVETWNRLSHQNPQRFVFVDNDGYLLVLRTRQDADRGTVEAFEAMLRRLQFLAGPLADRTRR